MSELPAAIQYMAEHGKMTDLTVSFTALSKDGRSGWQATCRRNDGYLLSITDLLPDPVTALMEAITMAWKDQSK